MTFDLYYDKLYDNDDDQVRRQLIYLLLVLILWIEYL